MAGLLMFMAGLFELAWAVGYCDGFFPAGTVDPAILTVATTAATDHSPQIAASRHILYGLDRYWGQRGSRH